MKTARNFAILALVALAIVAIPGGSAAASTIGTIVGIAILASLAVAGMRLYQRYRYTLESLPELDRVVLYASLAAVALAWVAVPRFRSVGAAGWLGLVAILALASFGIYWVFMRARRYD